MSTQERTPAQLHEHYKVEKRLAARLRTAPRDERRSLYNVVYDERLRAIPHHPLLTRAVNPAARERAVIPQLRLLRSFARPDTVFMEVGPGDCALAMAMANYVKHVYAVDVSEGLVQNVARPQNFELRLSDGINIPVPANAAHLAYSNQVMEHLHPDDAYDQLCNIHRALAPGGVYICITPNRLSGPWDISRHFDSVAAGLHLREYTLTELAQMLKSAGFSNIDTFVSCRGYILSPMLGEGPVSAVEWLLDRMPRGVRKQAARPLSAVKLIAAKEELTRRG